MNENEILNIVNNYSIADRIRFIEAVVQKIREEELGLLPIRVGYSGENLLEFAGIWNEESAMQMEKAVEESRKIDLDEW
ncbi:MAG: hypothetical protein GVX78_01720 [Bacteroidetes bacterium]|jgi:hypothetical protein|nr:hypothetical protein [Bacteroidota bacterium]